MDINFATSSLRKLCNKKKKARRKLGAQNAATLRKRLDDLRAVACLEDMRHLPGRVHPMKGDRAGQFSLDLEGGDRLFFVPNHDSLPKDTSGGLDRTQITAVTIVDIDDPHG